jgi:hypothetical protein
MSENEQLGELRTALELRRPIQPTGAMPGEFFVQRHDGQFERCHPGFVALILSIEGDSIFVKRLTEDRSEDAP